jgi:hypothetical protein
LSVVVPERAVARVRLGHAEGSSGRESVE